MGARAWQLNALASIGILLSTAVNHGRSDHRGCEKIMKQH
jgi:hypothetical protein